MRLDAMIDLEGLEQILVGEQREDVLPQRVLHVRLGQDLQRIATTRSHGH